jgi:hypothetical protein
MADIEGLQATGRTYIEQTPDLGKKMLPPKRRLGEPMATAGTNGERWRRAEIHRIAGDIELQSPEQRFRQS